VSVTLTSSTLERYVDRISPVHALDARVKVLMTLGYILTLAFLPHGEWAALAGLAGLLWWGDWQARIGLGLVIRRAFVALPFALVAVSLVFARPGAPLFDLTIGPWQLTASDAGLIAFISVVIKSWLSVQAALMLIATTQVVDVFLALRAFRLPTVLVAVMAFAYRYLFVLIDEASRMLRARECRSAAHHGRRGGGSIGWRAAVVGQMVGTLFLRSYERSERIYVAMLSRGYRGEVRTLDTQLLDSRDRGTLIGVLATLALIIYAALVW